MNRLALRIVRAVAVLIATAAPLFSQAPAEPYAEALDYEYGKPRAALFEIEGRIRSARPEELRAIEARLLATIRSPAATLAAREWACRQLRLAGSERAAPLLASLLTDPKLHTAARWALQAIPGPAPEEAIREAMPRLEGDLKAGAIFTLGARRDRKAVAVLAPLASEPDEKVAEAALYALGQIGGADALGALEGAKVPARLEAYRSHAILLAAERFLEEGERARAAELYRRLYETGTERAIRAGALRGLLLSGAPGAAEAAAALLCGGDPELRATAAKLVCEVARPEVLDRVFSDLGSYPPPARIQLLELASEKSALPAIVRAAREGEDAVRAAALAAAGRLGDPSSAGILLEAAAKGAEAVRA
ncbi:MAG: HEAT repeat domain-containing protein, partial [Planctomycetota bacterium]